MSTYPGELSINALPYKRRWNQFSLRSMLYGLTFATLLVGVLTIGAGTALLLVLFEVMCVFAGVECLMRNLPRSIEKACEENSVRADGSWSRRRAKEEQKSRTKLRLHLWLLFALCLTPGNILLFGIHTFVVPVSIGFDAMSSFRSSPNNWKDQLRAGGIESRFDAWYNRHGYRHVPSSQMKRTLWSTWPAFFVVVLTWIAVCWLTFKRSYFSALQTYASEIKRRSDQYMAVDVARYHDASAMPVD